MKIFICITCFIAGYRLMKFLYKKYVSDPLDKQMDEIKNSSKYQPYSFDESEIYNN